MALADLLAGASDTTSRVRAIYIYIYIYISYIISYHLPPWISSLDLFRHRRVVIVYWGVHDLFFF